MAHQSLSVVLWLYCLLTTKCEQNHNDIDLDFVVRAFEDLSVTGTELAVIDSKVSFAAKFRNGTFPPKSIQYVWKTNACSLKDVKCVQETRGGSSSSVTFVPSKFDALLAGKYKVDVTAQNGTQTFGKGSHSFTLTDDLNGVLNLKQNTSYKPQSGTFSTNKPLHLHASVFDKFSDLQGYTCVWKILGPQNKTLDTKTLDVNYTIATTGLYEVRATVTAHYNITDPVNYTHSETRDMNLVREVFFYDSISSVNVLGDRHYIRGSNLTMIVECSGSPPFHFDVTLHGPDHKIIERRISESNCCMLLLRSGNLTVAGTYTVVYDLHNSVSRHDGNITIDVVKPPDIASDDAILILAIVIGIAAPAIIIYVYIKEHSKGGSIESANFSFHPLTTDQGTCTRVCTAIKKCLLRLCCRTRHKRSPPRELRNASSLTRRENHSSGSNHSSNAPNYGAAGSSFSCGASGIDGNNRRCSTPWLEQSSENPSSSQNGSNDHFQSHWLIEHTSPITSASRSEESQLQCEDAFEDQDAWQPRQGTNTNIPPEKVL